MAGSSPVLDGQAVASLRRLGALERIVAVFLETTPSQLNQVRQALAGEDREGLGRLVHSLKGSAAYLGAIEMMQRCKELEELARDADSEAWQAGLDAVVGAFERLAKELRRRL